MDKRKSQRHRIAVDNTVKIPDKQGNGILRYFVSVDRYGKLARYSLAYINFDICTVDNGRVIGFDNCHGHHHKHYMGKEVDIQFMSLTKIEEQFEIEWRELHEKIKKHKKS